MKTYILTVTFHQWAHGSPLMDIVEGDDNFKFKLVSLDDINGVSLAQVKPKRVKPKRANGSRHTFEVRGIDFCLNKMRESHPVPLTGKDMEKLFKAGGYKPNGATARLSDLGHFEFASRDDEGRWRLTDKGRNHSGPCPVRQSK